MAVYAGGKYNDGSNAQNPIVRELYLGASLLWDCSSIVNNWRSAYISVVGCMTEAQSTHRLIVVNCNVDQRRPTQGEQKATQAPATPSYPLISTTALWKACLHTCSLLSTKGICQTCTKSYMEVAKCQKASGC